MAKIIVYNNDTDRMETYYKGFYELAVLRRQVNKFIKG